MLMIGSGADAFPIFNPVYKFVNAQPTPGNAALLVWDVEGNHPSERTNE
jgi:hypothetical protein